MISKFYCKVLHGEQIQTIDTEGIENRRNYVYEPSPRGSGKTCRRKVCRVQFDI